MSNSSKNTKAELKTRNEKNAKFAEFVAQRKAKAEAIKIAKAQRKATTTSERMLGKENYILSLIYNAGENGILVSELVNKGAQRVHPKTGEIDEVSSITINHNWNVSAPSLEETGAQRGELKLRDPMALPTNKGKNKEGIGEVYFSAEDSGIEAEGFDRKNNNLIVLEFGHEAVKNYLLKVGAEENENGEIVPKTFFDETEEA